MFLKCSFEYINLKNNLNFYTLIKISLFIRLIEICNMTVSDQNAK